MDAQQQRQAATNYFRVGPEPFFFVDHDEGSVYEAFNRALQHRATIHPITHRPPVVAFSRPRLRGPWDEVIQLVGEAKVPAWAVVQHAVPRPS